MEKSKLFIAAVLMLVTCSVSNVFAEEAESAGATLEGALNQVSEALPVGIEVGMSVASAYIWRGQNLGTDASFQPYVTLSPEFVPGSLSFTIWADITKNEEDRNLREIDYAVDYSFGMLDVLGLEAEGAAKAADFSLSTGYIYYDFPPSGGTKSQEIYWGIDYNLPLSPSFYVYNDWDRGRGLWYEFGISQDIDLKVITLSTYATLGYNHKQWGTTSALSTLDMGVSVPLAIGEHVTIEPFLSYTKRLKSTYTDDGADLTHDELYGGMNFSFAF